VNGYQAVLNAAQASQTFSDAYTAGTQNSSTWNAAFRSNDASAVLALLAGGSCLATTCNSQVITFQGYNAGASNQSKVFGDSLGNLNLQPKTSSLVLSSGAVESQLTLLPQFVLNATGANFGLVQNTTSNSFSLAHGASAGALGTTDLTWGTAGVVINNPIFSISGATSGTLGLQTQSATPSGTLLLPTPAGNGVATQVIASGTSTLNSGALAAVTCQATVTTTATGAATTDAIEWSFATVPGTADGLTIVSAAPTTNNVNFVRCNPTAASQTTTALVINWRVVR
jgi:hypothetical protein